MSGDWANVAGLIGSAVFIGAFAYANAAKSLNKIWFNLANLIGAILLLMSLWVHFNLAAFTLESVWAMIATWGLIGAARERRAGGQTC